MCPGYCVRLRPQGQFGAPQKASGRPLRFCLAGSGNADLDQRRHVLRVGPKQFRELGDGLLVATPLAQRLAEDKTYLRARLDRRRRLVLDDRLVLVALRQEGVAKAVVRQPIVTGYGQRVRKSRSLSCQ